MEPVGYLFRTGKLGALIGILFYCWLILDDFVSIYSNADGYSIAKRRHLHFEGVVLWYLAYFWRKSYKGIPPNLCQNKMNKLFSYYITRNYKSIKLKLILHNVLLTSKSPSC